MTFFKQPFWRASYREFCKMLGNQPSLRQYFEPLLQVILGGYHSELYRASVIEVKNSTSDMVTITLRVSKRWVGFQAGQHVMLTRLINGKYVSRPFSISSGESLWSSHRQIQISCKIKPEGELTSSLCSLCPTESLFISAAQGSFILPKTASHITLVCAGSGITPMRAYLQTQDYLSKSGESLFPCITLVYRYRGNEQAAFIEELRDLAQVHSTFTLMESDSLQEPDFDNVFHLSVINQPHFYLCGPVAFMRSVKANLLAQGVNSASIFQEHFGPQMVEQKISVDTTAYFNAKFQKAGKQFSVAAASSKSLLDSALESGVEPIFGCRMGVCFQCVCNKLAGQVKDIRTGELSGTGKEQIQLCVYVPVSDVSFEY